MGTTSEVVIHGELDLASAPVLESSIRLAFRGEPETIVLDLRGVTFIDSFGVAVTRDAVSRADDTGVRLVVLATAGPVSRLFELCGIASVLAERIHLPMAEMFDAIPD
jgi:anti-anti-sigma factor